MKFLKENRVFFVGLLSAVVLTFQQYVQAGPVSWKALGLAIAIAVSSFIANQWKAKTASILGIVGAVAAAVSQQLIEGKPLTWMQLASVLLVALLGYMSEGLRAPENREFIPNQK